MRTFLFLLATALISVIVVMGFRQAPQVVEAPVVKEITKEIPVGKEVVKEVPKEVVKAAKDEDETYYIEIEIKEEI